MSVTVKNGNSLFLINYATQILCFVVVTPLVWLRIFVRWRLKPALGIDDAACVIGWVLFMGYCANALIYGFLGCTVQPSELSHASKVSYVATAIYAPTALFVKSSLIYVLIRVFQPFYTGMIALYCLLGVTVGYYVIITFIKIFICNPVSAYWRQSESQNATCLSQPGVIIADSIISFLTDIAIFAFPVALTWTLQMPIWKKIRVVFLLGLGGIAVAFSLFRLVIGVHEKNRPHETTIYMRSILTANAEIGLGLVCACLPALNVLTTHNKQRAPEAKGIFTRRKKNAQSTNRIFDGDQFSHTQLSSCARRGSTDSASLMASHQASGFPIGDGSDTIIRMVSLNQRWETASQSNQRTDRSEII
ncbi:hypothetical protein N7481_000194 [Penicillium waksmanii]|uniref:uncharacterized protein n=1 Tax=Penicillium waksmanii TaxID=69791 RepID=UPI0025492690|nr:uncharacterized protein N7481_000194 [Penicillium waksmanii]KAJ5999785.1 hypothetical protein N7481_000194 [Penicillium waksmanii]